MLFSRIDVLYVAAALLPGVLAQTFTSCNPMNTTCPNDPALGTTYTHNFATDGASSLFTATGSAAKIKYDSTGMILPVAKSGDSPTITSNFYIFWGKVDIVMKSAPGQGIISSLVLESDDLDEIDYEWVGSETTQVQTNYFGKGDTSSYDRGATFTVANPGTVFNTYTIEWTKDNIIWSFNGTPLRTLLPTQVTPDALHSDLYPQTPMQIKIGSWSGGDPANAPGTIEWAGGPTDYNAGPYDMVVQSITIQDYSTGATEYKYGDKSGEAASIEIIKGGASIVASSSSTPSAASSSTSSAAASGYTTSTPTKSGSPSKTSSSASSSTTTDLTGMIIAGLPNSVGNVTVGSNDAVVNGTTTILPSGTSTATSLKTSTTSASKTTGTGSTTAAVAPASSNGAVSMREVGFGGLLLGVAAFAAML